MPDAKLSALSAAAKVLQNSIAYVVQGGASLKATISQFLLAGAPDQAAASQAGNPIAIAASDAVAGSSVAGAAAGGNVTVDAGDAARNASGNANGGDYQPDHQAAVKSRWKLPVTIRLAGAT